MKKINLLNPFQRKYDNRIAEIDFFRGLTILVVILYHTCWDIYYIRDICSNYTIMMARYPSLNDFNEWVLNSILSSDIIHNFLVYLVGGIFLFICGISTSLSRNNAKRAIILLIFSIIISLATGIFSIVSSLDVFIDFGIIHVMAISILLYAILNKASLYFFKKDASTSLIILFAIVLAYISIITMTGYLPLNDYTFTSWPVESLSGGPLKELLKNPFAFLLSGLGYYRNKIDWWPILPYTSVIFFGIALGKVLYSKEKKSKIKFLESKIFKPITFIGQHTLFIYLVHQVLIILVLFIICLILGFKI